MHVGDGRAKSLELSIKRHSPIDNSVNSIPSDTEEEKPDKIKDISHRHFKYARGRIKDESGLRN